jgi:hypothetical protein
MHDPSTLAFDIKYPWKSRGDYRESFISIWHVDPEKPDTGNRSDDSCGWFDRTPGPFADAVNYLLRDQGFMHDVKNVIARRDLVQAPFYEGISERPLHYHRLSAADSLAVVWMIASALEMRRWWNGQNGKTGASRSFWMRRLRRQRPVVEIAANLALNPIDNLSSVEEPEAMVRLIAAALNRHFRPWWRHPRWHVWHWKIQVRPLQKLNRFLFERCASCGRGYPYGYSPIGTWEGDKTFHHECYSRDALVPPGIANPIRSEDSRG